MDDFVKAKKVQLRLDDQDGIQEVQSVEQIHATGSSVAMGDLSDGFVKSNELEAKVERLGVLAVALFAMGVGYLLK